MSEDSRGKCDRDQLRILSGTISTKPGLPINVQELPREGSETSEVLKACSISYRPYEMEVIEELVVGVI